MCRRGIWAVLTAAGVAVLFVLYAPCRVREVRIPAAWLNAWMPLRLLYVGDARKAARGAIVRCSAER